MLVGVVALARRLGISPSTCSAGLRSGLIPAARVGRTYVCPEHVLARWLAAQLEWVGIRSRGRPQAEALSHPPHPLHPVGAAGSGRGEPSISCLIEDPSSVLCHVEDSVLAAPPPPEGGCVPDGCADGSTHASPEKVRGKKGRSKSRAEREIRHLRYVDGLRPEGGLGGGLARNANANDKAKWVEGKPTLYFGVELARLPHPRRGGMMGAGAPPKWLRALAERERQFRAGLLPIQQKELENDERWWARLEHKRRRMGHSTE